MLTPEKFIKRVLTNIRKLVSINPQKIERWKGQKWLPSWTFDNNLEVMFWLKGDNLHWRYCPEGCGENRMLCSHAGTPHNTQDYDCFFNEESDRWECSRFLKLADPDFCNKLMRVVLENYMLSEDWLDGKICGPYDDLTRWDSDPEDESQVTDDWEYRLLLHCFKYEDLFPRG